MNREDLLKSVLSCCNPKRVILYGEKFVVDSHDLKSADLCIILDQCDKKTLLSKLYLKVTMPIPVQFLLYSTEEWDRMLQDSGSYASAIEKKGTVLYGEKAQG
ncbi:MAG: hypothetical protein PUE91_09235 [Clostridiales bacterium]|nr:hypothetical protein [Clostridiales bacterium]